MYTANITYIYSRKWGCVGMKEKSNFQDIAGAAARHKLSHIMMQR
jgi:hypothetical protein